MDKQCLGCGQVYPEDEPFYGGACVPCNEEEALRQEQEQEEELRWAEYAEEEYRAGRI